MMKVITGVLIAVLSLFAAALLILHIKSRRPLRSAVINALCGILALAAVNLTCKFTGVRIPVNIYTFPGIAVFGIPACAALVIFKMFI
ncbi:MAG: pro-sigmaK processing inhibitor BofA family protein [Clostridia bacterium]|nr:pro-sigmaK processing inhibitor BofA family protein [Clostridia bacterium]